MVNIHKVYWNCFQFTYKVVWSFVINRGGIPHHPFLFNIIWNSKITNKWIKTTKKKMMLPICISIWSKILHYTQKLKSNKWVNIMSCANKATFNKTFIDDVITVHIVCCDSRALVFTWLLVNDFNSSISFFFSFEIWFATGNL